MRLPLAPTGLLTRILAVAVPAASLALLAACGNFTLDDPPASSNVERRVYVNDKSANDSLPRDFLRQGIKFVLQPGRTYELSVDNTSRTADKLKLFYFDGGVSRNWQTLGAATDGTHEVFSFKTDQTTAQFFMARLVAPEGVSAASLLPHISLATAAGVASDTLHVRLMFIRKLRNLPDSASKAALASKVFVEMAKIYGPIGITLVGTYEIVEPLGAALTFPFSNTFVPLPGNRTRNNAHLYLVDSISIGDPNSGLVGEVLGFAPREVVDLDNHRESRVLLSGRIGDARSIAITASHELGHFFGLRHTVSTLHDILQDDDRSNDEDGFDDTRFCNLDIALAKSAPVSWTHPTTSPYCLRMADNSCSRTSGCDLKNLMHPVDCGTGDQITLSAQQTAFLKKNIGSYKH